MIRNIFIGTVIVALMSVLFWGFITELSTASGTTIPTNSTATYTALSSNLTSAYNDVSGYAQAGYSGVAGVNTNPTVTENQDIVSTMGRFATSVVKTFINAFTIPIVIIESFAIALGIPIAYFYISGFVITLFLTMVVLEIVSLAIRYPIDR